MPTDELSSRYRQLAQAVDSVLVAHHGLRSHLRAGAPPLLALTEEGLVAPMPVQVGQHHFGPGPMFDVWCECRSMEWLRLVWTGAMTAGSPEPIPAPDIKPAKPEADEDTPQYPEDHGGTPHDEEKNHAIFAMCGTTEPLVEADDFPPGHVRVTMQWRKPLSIEEIARMADTPEVRQRKGRP